MGLYQSIYNLRPFEIHFLFRLHPVSLTKMPTNFEVMTDFAGTIFSTLFSMKDFAVNMINELTGKYGLYMYIGFTERYSPDHNFIDCYGSAIILLEDQKEYQFDYAFGHTPDWIVTTEIMLRPVKTYNLGVLLLTEVGGNIVKSIRDFISQLN